MRVRDASIVLLAVLPAMLGAGRPADVTSLVVVRGGSTFSVSVENGRGFPATQVGMLAEALGYQRNGSIIDVEGERVRFIPGSPFFSVGREVYQLANPVYAEGSRLMVPLSWALDWLPRARPRAWRYMDGRLVARPPLTLQPPEREHWLVVLDPGHGGKDPGAVGVMGTREKDVTLAIAELVAKRLGRERDVEVVLTRDSDTLIALADRPRLAQALGHSRPPDLFVSVHANSMPRKPNAARGHETYFLAVAKTEQARQVAMRENSALQFEEATTNPDLEPLQFMLSDLQSTGNLRESSLLAAAIDRGMRATLKTPALGVKQAGFLVLVGATMPAALVEVGYLSNRDEERQLRSPSYQAKIADALADAIVNYLEDYGRRVWSSYSSDG